MPSGELTHLSLFSGIGGLDLAAEWAGFTTVGLHGAGGRGCDEQGGKRLKLGSLFDGSGGFPLSGVLNGIEPVWAAEVEPYPIAVTRSRFPHMKHYGDVSKMRGAELEPVDIVTFGSPCQDMSIAGKREGLKHEAQGDEETTRSGLFYEAIRIVKEMRSSSDGRYPRFAVWENVCFAAGTLVTCEGGYKPIERVFVGEKVKTLSGKYLPVVKVHKTKRQNVLNLSVSGGEDLVVTGNHPFYARQKTYDTGGRKTITDAQWTEAKNLTAKHLIAYRIDEPTLPEHIISETDAWILGRWLADGSVDLTKANPRIFVSVGSAKLEEVRDKLRSLPYEFYESKPHDTVTNFTFTSNEFYSLIAECGVGAGQKRVAPFIFALPHTLQQRVLEGYMSGDGYTRKRFNGTEITAGTASRELAYGIARLIRNCYKTSANISCRHARNGLIDGRVIKANYPSYNITACIGGKSSQSFFDGEFVWQPVRSIRPLKEKQDVYNLSVLEDNTYAANDIICHNCGAFSSNKGYDFHAVLEALCSVCDSTVSIPRPSDPKRPDNLVWNKAGEIVGDNYSIAWRTLDAQYWGVPQRRKRIYLVADFTGRCAGEILFKQDRLPWNHAESRKAGQGSTADAVGGVDGSIRAVGIDGYNFALTGDKAATVGVNCGISTGRNGVIESVDGSVGDECLNPWDCQSKRIYQPQGIYPTLPAMDCGGANNQAVIFSFDSLSSNSMKSSNPLSGCRAVEVAKCIDTTYPDPSKNQGGVAVVQPLVLKERAGCDGGGKGALWSDKAFTLATNQDMSVIVLQANGIDRADTAGCNGAGWREDQSYTLNTVDRHAVCYPLNEQIILRHGALGKNTGFGAGDDGDPAYTLQANHPHAVCYGIDQQGGKGGANYSENIMPTICSDSHGTPHAVCYQESVGALQARDYKGVGNQYVGEEKLIIECYDARGNGDGETACTITGDHQNRITDYTAVAVQKTLAGDDVAGCLKARDYKGCEYLNETLSKCVLQETLVFDETQITSPANGNNPQWNEPSHPLASTARPPTVICKKPPRKYIIRRLTPTECARLQGFPDDWGHLAPYNPADAEFWEIVRKTHAEINGKAYKPVKNLKAWYEKLHNDGAEYKMWGNGIAIPCAEYVIRRIAETVREEEKLSAEETI